MSTIKINELATTDISLSDFIAKADDNGLATKNTIQKLGEFLSTTGDVSFKGSLLIADTPTEDGWYFAGESGTYTNAGNLVVDISNQLVIIIVEDTQTTFSKIDIPISLTFDNTPISGSTNAVESGGVYDALVLKADSSKFPIKSTDLEGNIPKEKIASVDGSSVEDDSIGYNKLTQAAKDIIEATGGGNITNNPDDITLQTNASQQLEIKKVTSDKIPNEELEELNSRSVKSVMPLTGAGTEKQVEYDLTKPFFNIELPDTSIRENCVFFWKPSNKYYVIADIMPLANQHHPNTYDTEIGLFRIEDDGSATYLGICIEKGGVGELAEFGVASPTGCALFKNKVYVPFSARNNSGFTNRSIGLAYSGNPESLPWTKLSDAVVDTLGEDDDPSCVVVPGDEYLHIYNRSTLPYRIVHSKSKTPEIANSWAVINNATEEISGTAQELTSCFFADGCLQMYVLEQGAQTGTAHLVSNNPDGVFEQANYERFIPNVADTAYNGHLTPVLKEYDIKGWIWTVYKDEPNDRYGLSGFEKSSIDSDIRSEISNYNFQKQPSFLLDASQSQYLKSETITSNLDADNGEFTILIKAKLNDVQLDSASDQYCLFSFGSEGVGVAGGLMVNFRGSASYGSYFARLHTSSGNFIDVRPSFPLTDVQDLVKGKNNVYAIRRDSDGDIQTLINGVLIGKSPSDSTVRLNTSQPIIIGGLDNGVIPFDGEMFEVVILNKRLSDVEINNYNSGILEYGYNVNDVERITFNLIFDKFSNKFIDLSSNSYVVTANNYSESQHKGVSKSANETTTLNPVFRAGMTAVQSIPDSTSTKVIMTEVLDNKNYYDNGRFTPLEEGYYEFSSFIQLTSFSSDKRILLEIKKNGVRECHLTMAHSSVALPIGCGGTSPLIYMNGTTDYVELFIYQDTGASRDISADTTISYFSGKKVNV